MLVKLTEILRGMRGGSASLNEIYVNSTHIISVSEDIAATESLINESKRLGLISGVKFSKIVLSEGNQTRSLTVVGAPADINNQIRKNKFCEDKSDIL